MVIHVAPHNFFTRIGNDIHCQVKVSFTDAARGGVLLVPTLDGYQTVQLPQGTETGWVCRFPGAGAPGEPRPAAGDQVMEIVVTTANDFYPRQEELLEEVYRLGSERQTGASHE